MLSVISTTKADSRYPTTHRAPAPALKTESQQSRGQCCFCLSVRSTREGKIVEVDIDYESRQPIHTPAYHTSEQSTLQTPHPTLSLSGPSHNISQYLRRFPSYDLQLTTYDFPALLYWDPLGPTTTNNHQPTLTAISELRLTTYDFLAFDWDPPPPAVSHSVQSLSAASQHLRRFPSYDLRLMTSQLCFTGTHHHQQPTTTSSLSLTQFNCSLRLVTTRLTFNRSLRLTTYDLRLTTYDIPALLYWDPPTTSSLSLSSISLSGASQPTLTPLSEYPLSNQTSQHHPFKSSL